MVLVGAIMRPLAKLLASLFGSDLTQNMGDLSAHRRLPLNL